MPRPPRPSSPTPPAGAATPAGPATSTGLAALARGLCALPASCGQVRLIGIDGHAGSGKSTLADHLSRELGDAPVLQLDELSSHQSFFGWRERLAREVLAPLSRGEPASHSVYDWTRRTRTAHRTLPPAPVVLLEGVGAGRRELRPQLACLLWMDLSPERSWARGRARDGQRLTAFWDEWVQAERAHFAADPTAPHADLLLRQRPAEPAGAAATQQPRGPAQEASPPGEPSRTGPRGSVGYEVLPGPAARKGTPFYFHAQ